MANSDVDVALLNELDKLWTKLQTASRNRLPCHLTGREASIALQCINSMVAHWPGTQLIRESLERKTPRTRST